MTAAADILTVEIPTPKGIMLSAREELTVEQVACWVRTHVGTCWVIAPTWTNYWNHAPCEWRWTDHSNPYWNEDVKLWCWLLVKQEG